MELVKVGDRVKVKSLGIKGTVEYIDQPNLYRDHMYPIQIQLDKPWYDDGGGGELPNAYMYRTGLRDIVKLKKKVTRNHIPSRDDSRTAIRLEIKQFLKWLKNY